MLDRRHRPRHQGPVRGWAVTKHTRTSLMRALLVFSCTMAGSVLAAPAAHAAPLTLPGTGSTSGSSSTPPPESGSNGHEYAVGANRVRLKDWPAGTGLSQKFVSGYCLDEADDAGFSVVQNPFKDCTYRQATAKYDYAITLPDGRVMATRLEWSKNFAGSLRVRCVWSLGRCAARNSDNDDIYRYVDLYYPNASNPELNNEYCTTEGYKCSLDNRNSFTMRYGSVATPSKFTRKQFPRRAAGTDTLEFECTTASFDNIDPDPGVTKYCERDIR